MSNRDTQFQGFAKLLLKKMFAAEDIWIDTINPHWEAEWEQIIAQGAYDLACHIVRHINERDLALVRSGMWSEEDCVARIPNMEEQTNEGETNA